MNIHEAGIILYGRKSFGHTVGLNKFNCSYPLQLIYSLDSNRISTWRENDVQFAPPAEQVAICTIFYDYTLHLYDIFLESYFGF